MTQLDEAASKDALLASEARFRTLAASTPTAIFECDLSGEIYYANDRWFDLVGGKLSGGEALADRIHESDLSALADLWATDKTASEPSGFDARFRMIGDGSDWRWIDIRIRPVVDGGGIHRSYLGAMHDVTELVEAKQKSQRFKAILEATSDLVAIVGEDLEIDYLNPAARDAIALSEFDTPRAMELSKYLGEGELERIIAESANDLIENRVWNGETLFQRAGGVSTTLSHVIVRGEDDDGTSWFASLARDVAEDRVHVSSTTGTERRDGLTGLTSRAEIFAEVRRSLDRVVGTPLSIGVLFIDVDHFQMVNDSYGHEVGDELLVTIAQRLRASSGPNTVLGRFGSDEFIVLVEGMTSPVAMHGRAQFLLDRLNGEVQLSAGPAHLSVSIGVITDDGSGGAGSVLRDVDATASLAKRRGRGRIEVFDHRVHDQVVTRLATELELRHGLDQDQFVLHYQPVVRLGSSEIIACEALVRWQHPRYGLLGPDAFLSVVEECGLASRLGAWVLCEALATAATWRAQSSSIVVAVNVAADQLSSPNFVSEVHSALAHAGLNGTSLCLEVTEGIVMADPSATARKLEEIREMGVTIAIDDFGTGYSSLSHLTRLPVDTLKVDKSFVQGLGEHVHDDAVTATVVGLAHSLGLHVVAEGVESNAQLAALSELGCDAVQGFLFSHPLVADDLKALLSAGSLKLDSTS